MHKLKLIVMKNLLAISLLSGLFIVMMLVVTTPVFATPGPPPPPAGIPIDGFASVILIAAGGALGAKHLKKKFKKQD